MNTKLLEEYDKIVRALYAKLAELDALSKKVNDYLQTCDQMEEDYREYVANNIKKEQASLSIQIDELEKQLKEFKQRLSN